MANIYGLGPRYDLSPAALAGLANIAGQKPPPVNPSPPDIPSADEFERRMVEGALPANPTPEDVARAKRTVEDAANLPTSVVGATNPTRIPGWTPEKQKESDEQAARDEVLKASNPQGPAQDNFPSVRQDLTDDGQMPSFTRPTPAHWQSTTHDITTERNMDPNSLDQARDYAQDAAGQQLLAHDKRMEAAVYQGAMDSAQRYGKKMADDYYGARLREMEAHKEAYQRQEMAKLNELVMQANVKPDPNAYWKDKGTAGKIFAAIAIGLGQFGASMTGGQNAAYQIIKDGIDRSMRAQEAASANARNTFVMRQSLYQNNLAVLGDKERALLATRMQYLDNVTDTIKQGMLGRGKAGADAEAQKSEFLQKFYDDRAKLETEFAKLTAVKATEKSAEKFVPANAGGPADNKREALYVPTLGGYARDEPTARELNKKGALRMQMLENMHQIDALLEKAKGMNSLTSPLALAQMNQQIETLVNDTLTKNTVIEGQGAMSEGDKVVAQAAKGLKDLSANFRTNGQITRSQENVRKAATNIQVASRLDKEGYGIQSGKERYRPGPNGPVPTQQLEGRTAPVSKQTTAVDDLVVPPKGEVKKK